MTRILDRVPAKVRLLLDDWRPWMLLALVGVVFAISWLYFVNGRVVREAATRQATSQATKAANYRACMNSIPGLTKINTFLRGEQELVDVLAQNSLANVAGTGIADPLYETRLANLHRIVAARNKIAAVQELPVPTPAECLLRRGA